jgi:hypothetical protein
MTVADVKWNAGPLWQKKYSMTLGFALIVVHFDVLTICCQSAGSIRVELLLGMDGPLLFFKLFIVVVLHCSLTASTMGGFMCT